MGGKSDLVKGALDLTAKLLSEGGEEAAKTGIRAYQGSPHNFAAERLVRFPEGRTEYIVGQPDVLPDVPEGAEVLQDFPLGRMRMDKIGTGEGAQAYGHGLYLAEQEGVAKDYRKNLAYKNLRDKFLGELPQDADFSEIEDLMSQGYFSPDQTRFLTELKNNDWLGFDYPSQAISAASRGKISNYDPSPELEEAANKLGHMYEVNIAADPNTFLDWDKPLNEQPGFLKSLGNYDPDYNVDYEERLGKVFQSLQPVSEPLGQDFYAELARGNKKGAAAMLKNLGVPGIKYLDAGSRVPSAMAKKELADWQAQLSVAERELADATARGDEWLISRKKAEVKRVQDGIARVAKEAEGTRNYVVFDDNLISIIRKYGIAGASAMLGYNLMENLDANQAQAATVADKEYQATQPEVRGGMLPPGMEPSGEMTSRTPSASERIYDYVRSVLGGDEATKGQRAQTVMNIIDQTPLAVGPMAYDIARGATEMAGYYKGGAVRKGYATDGAVQPGPVFMEDAKGNKYDVAGNLIPPTNNAINDAVMVARREVDPYLKVPGHEHLKAVPPVTPPRPEYVPGEAISAATQPSRDVFWQGVEQFRNPQTEPRTPERAWELLSGAGQIGLGALGTAASGVVGAGVEALPTWLTGPQNQRNKLASELNEMAMFADPMLGPDALAATAPVQRVGGVRNAMAIEGDLAKQRMAERGPATFYDPLKVASGVDPTEAGKAIANAKDTAIAKVGDVVAPALKAAQETTGEDQVSMAAKIAQEQRIDDQMEAAQPPSVPPAVSPDAPTKAFVQYGKPIPPSAPPPDPALLQTAQADTRMGADIVKRRLPIIVPEQERVVGGVYTPGAPDGRRWSELTPEELSVRGTGAGFTNDDLQNIWNQTLSEVSEAGRQAVANTGATWKAFPAEQWDKALKLPLRSQLWYELSGEAFVDRLPDLKYNEHMMFLDLVGATSARARPGENLERALAVLSQRLRGVPVDVDVTIPSTVSAALRRDGRNVSSDLANKTGMFSDTLALTGGIPTRYPISVNDVWVGKAFGITDDQLSGNQALHEVFGKYTNKLRDLVNETSPSPYPHQSWNLQSRQWVELRAADEGLDTSVGSTVEGSDYAGEWDKILQKLQKAGIDVPEGKITRDVLMDPRFADALRSTTPAFRAAPKATVEFGTLLTPNGQKAASIYDRARQVGDQNTQDEYLAALTTSMYGTARGKPTLWETTARTALGNTTSVTRIYSPTRDDPFAISGTFGGAAAPNIRVPLRDLTPDQIAYFNAVAGKGLRQKAMAAVEITRLDPDQALPEGAVLSRAVRFDFDGPVPQKMLTDFASALGEGFEISAMRYPDGMVFDINPRFGDAGPEAPSIKAVDNAIDTIRSSYGIENPEVFDISYKSEYGKNYVEDPGDGSSYQQIINDTIKGWEADAVAQLRTITEGKISDAVLKRYLKGNDAALKDAAKQGGFPVSGYTGKAKTVRKVFQQRLSDHASVAAQWDQIGKEIDDKLGALIPKWERRYAQAEKKSIKEAPQRATEQGFTTEAYRGSNRDIQEYGKTASDTGYYGGKPTYFTSSPEDAGFYTRVPVEEFEVTPYNRLKILKETNPNATLQDVLNDSNSNLSEEYVNRLLGGENLGTIYPSKLRMENPVRVGGEGETVFQGSKAANMVKIAAETLAERGIPENVSKSIVSRLDELLQSGGFGAMDFDLAVRDAARSADKLMTNKIGSVLTDIYEKAGFDSIDLDASVFSRGRGGGGNYYAYNVTPGTRHYLILNPENIRGRFAKFGGYGPEGPAYMKAMGGAVEDDDIYDALRIANLHNDGRVTGSTKYADSDTVSRALTLTSKV